MENVDYYTNFGAFYQLYGPPMGGDMDAELDLKSALMDVINSPRFSLLSNENKSHVLLMLENDGEYDPNGY